MKLEKIVKSSKNKYDIRTERNRKWCRNQNELIDNWKKKINYFFARTCCWEMSRNFQTRHSVIWLKVDPAVTKLLLSGQMKQF